MSTPAVSSSGQCTPLYNTDNQPAPSSHQSDSAVAVHNIEHILNKDQHRISIPISSSGEDVPIQLTDDTTILPDHQIDATEPVHKISEMPANYSGARTALEQDCGCLSGSCNCSAAPESSVEQVEKVEAGVEGQMLTESTCFFSTKLPQEVRCLIYEAAREPRIIEVNCFIDFSREARPGDPPTFDLKNTRALPPLLLTCKNSNEEASKYYQKIKGPYNNTYFDFRDTLCITTRFYSRIDSQFDPYIDYFKQFKIQHLAMGMEDSMELNLLLETPNIVPYFFHFFHDLPDLKSFTFALEISTRQGSPDLEALDKFYKDMTELYQEDTTRAIPKILCRYYGRADHFPGWASDPRSSMFHEQMNRSKLLKHFKRVRHDIASRGASHAELHEWILPDLGYSYPSAADVNAARQFVFGDSFYDELEMRSAGGTRK